MNKIEIGLRLKEFAKNKFGNIAELERVLGKSPAYFQNYINGRSFLGGEILSELRNLGCDINWLLTGEKSEFPNFHNVGDRIREIRKKLKLNQEQLAEYLGIESGGVVSIWENNKANPDFTQLVKIASLGKVTLDWLLTGIESSFEPPRTDLSTVYGDAHKVDLDMYPLVERVTAGNYQLITSQDNVTDYYPLPVKKKNSFLVEVEGDSMISSDPARSIVPGDLLLIDTIEIAMPGDIVVVLLNNDRQMVKQLFHKNGNFEFRSFNPNYPPIYATEEEVVCIYRVVYHQPKGRKL